MPRATLKDVAAHVGVSAKTVSNVVNGTGWVSESVASRVRASVIELGYRPNASARMLRSGKTGLVGVALPDLSQPYFAEVASHLVRVAENMGVTVVVTQTDGHAEVEAQIANGRGLPAVDGLIMSPLALNPEDLRHRSDPTPLVLLGEQIEEPDYCHVTVNNTEAARTATLCLLEGGRRRILALGAQKRPPMGTAELRTEGYRQALAEFDVPFDPDLLAYVRDYSRLEGFYVTRDLLAAAVPFDGVFAFNDLMAFGAIRAIHQAGLSVPEDVAVVGFDDVEESQFSTPTVTTISPDKEELARLALGAALETRRSDDPYILTVPSTLASRESA